MGEIAAQYLRKGSKVYIEGSLRTRKYQATDGSDRYATEIRADQMQMLDSNDDNKKQISHPDRQEPQNDQEAPNIKKNVNHGLPPGPVDDDIPFAPHFDGQF